MKTSNRVGIRTCSDYSPFGVELDGRTVSGGYRFGYQGSEKDDDVKGNGNSYTTEFRQLDPRLGRWLTIDALSEKYEDLSPYAFALNSPLRFIDIDGKDVIIGKLNKSYDLIKTPNCLGDLAYTENIPQLIFNKKTKQYDLILNATTHYYYVLNNSDNILEAQNPGFTLYSETHENEHYKANIEAAYMKVDYELNGKNYSGRVDEVFTQVKNDLELELMDFTSEVKIKINKLDLQILNTSDISQKNQLIKSRNKYVNNQTFQGNIINERIKNQLSQTYKDLINAYNVNSELLNQHSGMNGINKRTLDKLEPNSKAYNYQNGVESIYIDNHEINSCEH